MAQSPRSRPAFSLSIHLCRSASTRPTSWTLRLIAETSVGGGIHWHITDLRGGDCHPLAPLILLRIAKVANRGSNASYPQGFPPILHGGERGSEAVNHLRNSDP